MKQIQKTLMATMITAGLMLGYHNIDKMSKAPKEIVTLERDLNEDGVNDAYILQTSGHKRPMYGITDSNKIKYVSAQDLVAKTYKVSDFETIEDKLNEE